MVTKRFPDDGGFNSDAADLSKQPPSDCPRCGSINTKFCYYNNYNKSQPRHFCKSCKRHWTKGGAIRNIPAGRRRTNKRPRTSVAVEAEPQQKYNLESLLSLSTDQKNMSNILYQALIHSSSPPTSLPQSTILESSGTTTTTTHAAGLNASAPQNHSNTEFRLSSFTSLISNPTSDYNSAEESTVTTSAAPPWAAVSTAADLWSWNDGVDLMGDLNAVSVWDHHTFFEGSYPRFS